MAAEAAELRVALISMRHEVGRLADNMDRMERWLDRAMKKRPGFVGFPEFSITGWTYNDSETLTLRAAALSRVDRWARERGVWIGAPFVERRKERLFNTTLVTGPNGRAGAMRKVNLVTGEAQRYTPGELFPVFEVAGCALGVATCADATRFEMVHLLSLRGAEVVFAPHASVLRPYGNSRRGFVKWRMERWPLFARDCCCFVAGVNSAGLSEQPCEEEELSYCGGALVMDWRGRRVAALSGPGKREGMLVATLDLAALRRAREEHTLSAEFRPAIVYNRRRGWRMGAG